MLQKTEDRRQKTERLRRGSAIILAVVLTSLLAIIGVIFLLSSRVDFIATSAISENKDLNLAVDTVIAQISEDLAFDVFRGGIDPNQYCDYPDPCNPWLACLEPYQSGSYYFWQQVSNIYGPAVQNVQAQVLPDYNSMFVPYTQADADGDGVSDSMWVKIPDKTSAKGKPIYAAIRVIDNGGMLNVNTGFKFDPCDPNPQRIDGSSQTQINLMALTWRSLDPNSTYNPAGEGYLLQARAPANPSLGDYESYVVWQYGEPCGPYTPFDISDELELRNRFILNHSGIDTRLEDWGGEWRNNNILSTPVDSGGIQLKNWLHRAGGFGDPDPAIPPDPFYPYAYYAYRHIATTYNLDRIINPDGDKMLNINRAPQIDPNYMRTTIARALVDGGVLPADANPLGAQITANLIDYVDLDSEVSVVNDDANIPHFGFETPCIYISELVQSFVREPNTVSRSYAIELYKPYPIDPLPEPNEWQLVISGGPNNITVPITWPGNSPFFVVSNVNVNAPLEVNKVDANDVNNLDVFFGANDRIRLERDVNGFGFITVDEVGVPGLDSGGTGWLTESNDINLAEHSIQRDITLNKCIRRLWENPLDGFLVPATLGGFNTFVYPDLPTIQAHPANQLFTNVGEFGQLFYAPTYSYGGMGANFGVTVTEPEMRIDLTLPAYQQVFKYLTVMDPNELQYGGHPYDETRIKGRININTAPWFVIAQLPWLSEKIGSSLNYGLAQNIVAYRDKTISPTNVDFTNRTDPRGFQNIGQLNLVYDPNIPLASIDYYARGNPLDPNSDLQTFPDLTPADGAINDFEQRDVIFARISNLITVRSDVFTAYILVRIGQDGPQKRVVAILDRSGVTPAGGKVKVIVIQSVPDPR
jgi:hypothetical protein